MEEYERERKTVRKRGVKGEGKKRAGEEGDRK